MELKFDYLVDVFDTKIDNLVNQVSKVNDIIYNKNVYTNNTDKVKENIKDDDIIMDVVKYEKNNEDVL